jgi:N-acetyl-anhydromuramyl-L-alanine amidase AmpD
VSGARCQAAVLLLAACSSEPGVHEGAPARSSRVPEVGSSIVVGGEHVWIGAPVVLWFDPGGYSAYSTEPAFPAEPSADPAAAEPEGLRYEPGRETERGRVTRRSPRAELAGAVDQLVLHYDACGTSRQCFKVLHDRRGLSVHFLLDVDGTLYQTLDLADTAWHARQANPRSIGVEIANIGAYAPGADSPLDAWYAAEAGGATRLVLPPEPNGVRSAGFSGRPVRPGPITAEINGATLAMHDLTPEQYDTLARLTVALCRVFPRISPDAPRDADGRVPSAALPEDRWKAFSGILGHLHLARDKYDPGPAFDWERYLALVRSGLLAPTTP